MNVTARWQPSKLIWDLNHFWILKSHMNTRWSGCKASIAALMTSLFVTRQRSVAHMLISGEWKHTENRSAVKTSLSALAQVRSLVEQRERVCALPSLETPPEHNELALQLLNMTGEKTCSAVRGRWAAAHTNCPVVHNTASVKLIFFLSERKQKVWRTCIFAQSDCIIYKLYCYCYTFETGRHW